MNGAVEDEVSEQDVHAVDITFKNAAGEEIEPAIKKALEMNTTVVIDCCISPDVNVLPMIPPGKTVNEIVTEM